VDSDSGGDSVILVHNLGLSLRLRLGLSNCVVAVIVVVVVPSTIVVDDDGFVTARVSIECRAVPAFSAT